jgi:electron transfer flavoprotein alpha subunit
MSILVIAEHNNIEVKSSTLNTINAASKLGSEIEVLVLGSNIENISKEISSYQQKTEEIPTPFQGYVNNWSII